MSSLIHPIHTVRQKLRPKHQVLVLKCYPRYQKNVQDIKPNSSELSYLLYYASTRRSKLQKVGGFLEKKTASDIWRVKLGNVQITLQILTALMEKAPRDLPLYSHSVLTILDAVLKSKDINMIEESITTFETYCKYVDSSSLSADQARAHQYQKIAQTYASFASQEQLPSLKAAGNTPLAIRWRTAGLKAIRCVVGSDALGADSGKQLNFVMPIILENLHLEDDDILASLQQRAQTGEKVDAENARKRRMSIATVTTVDTVGDTNPITASETTADADKLAEDEVRVLAVRCLKQIFSAVTGSNRVQIRLATALTLRFIALGNPPPMPVAPTYSSKGKQGNWATSLIEAIARWTPVQDRFIIVVTAMETLVRSPVQEAVLDKQLALATMIDWLLSSSINLIGLSVMDVLLGFIQHTLLLLQLGGRDSKIAPHHQQPDALDIFQDAKETFEHGSPFVYPDRGRELTGIEKTPSPVRQQLLLSLQKCIGDLATHIYYTDQISDMMTAILARLKPSVQSDVTSTAAAINDPAAAADAIAKSVSLQEDPHTHSFFSFATARVTALRAIKDILVIANLRKTTTGASAVARSRVGIQVWEGTQWLLRDEDRGVRLAYVDALLTWLKLETNKNDLHLPNDGTRKAKAPRKDLEANGDTKLARRAASNASRKDSKPSRSTFLQLLHLAIYDNALESPEHEADILILHLLLTCLVDRLGVNAARSGLPMIMRLQEAVLHDETVESLQGRVHLASLVHGYLWGLTDKFDIEGTRVGGEVHAEISRRQRHGVWFSKIRVPALPLEQIPTTPTSTDQAVEVAPEALDTVRPFLDARDFVDEIARAYDQSLVTPVMSPPLSPGRVFSVPTLGFGYGYGVSVGPRPSQDDQFPQKVKDEMLLGWTRESCIMAVEKESIKTASITGSKTGTNGLKRNNLSATALRSNGSFSGRESPVIQQAEAGPVSPALGIFGGLGSLSKPVRRASTNGGSPVPLTANSSHDSTMRITELKQALSGYRTSTDTTNALRIQGAPRDSIDSDDSDSMISYDDDADGPDSGPVDRILADSPPTDSEMMASASRPARDLSPSKQSNANQSTTMHDTITLPRSMSDRRMGNDVPPVPKIPSTLDLPGTWPRDTSPVRPTTAKTAKPVDDPISPGSQTRTDVDNTTTSTSPTSTRPGRYIKRGTPRPVSRKGPPGGFDTRPKIDLSSLLAGIRTDGATAGEGGGEEEDTRLGGVRRPPY